MHRIFAVKGGEVLDDHLEAVVGSVHDDASSHLMTNERVDVHCCTPRAGLLLTHLEFAKHGCRRDCYGSPCILVPSGLDVDAASAKRANIVPLVLQTCSGSTGRGLGSMYRKMNSTRSKRANAELDASITVKNRCADVLMS